MQKEYPGVTLSVKTRQAIRAVLNHCRSTLDQLREGGVLEEHDGNILSQVNQGWQNSLLWCGFVVIRYGVCVCVYATHLNIPRPNITIHHSYHFLFSEISSTT